MLPEFLHYYYNRCYNANSMVLSNRTLKEGIANGRVIIKPLNCACTESFVVATHLDNKLPAKIWGF